MIEASAPGSAGGAKTTNDSDAYAHPSASRAAPPAEPGADVYDAIIVGAGPAGAVSAALLAARGWRVLLVEKHTWPRDKACGGCLNAAAVHMLHQLHLAEVLADAAPLHHMSLHMKSRALRIPLPPGVAIARHELDRRLVAAATARGTTFLPDTTASLLPDEPPLVVPTIVVQASRLPGAENNSRRDARTTTGAPFRTLRLRTADITRTVYARIVLACDGLRGTLLAQEPWARHHIDKSIRLGFATTLPAGSASPVPPNILLMLNSPAGYVGLVRLSQDQIHLGASLRPDLCNTHHGPLPVLQTILASCNFPPFEIPPTTLFTGTGPLTSHRTTVAGHRVLAVGDACGYVEPFTGEGISWAIRAAIAASHLLPDNPAEWPAGLPARWQQKYAAEIAHRQRWCRRLRSILHRPRLASACMNLATWLPWIPRQMAHAISA